MPRSRTSRSYCFTINKKHDDDRSDDCWMAEVVQGVLSALREAHESGVVRYWIVQAERGDDGGVLHMQGFCVFRQACRCAAVKRVLGCEWAHVEQRSPDSTNQQAADYCRKPESRVDGPWEGGDLPSGSGARSDILAAKAAIDAGQSELEVANGNFEAWCKFHGAFARYRALRCADKRREAPEVRVYVGPTGVGKSRSAWEEFPGLFAVPISAAGRTDWFDGYVGQRVVLFDDYRGDEYDVGFFLKLTDRYPMQVPYKGGFFPWCPEVLIFTSNVHPDMWYNTFCQATRDAVKRRITMVKMIEGEKE